MKSDDDDFRIGVPGVNRAAGAMASPLGGLTPPARHETEKPEEPPELRPGETELGRPPQVPSDLAPLSTADLAALKLLDDEQAARDVAEAEMLLASDPTGLGWLGWFGTPMAFAFLMGMTGVFGVFLFNQTASLLQTLAAVQEDWIRYTGYAGLALLGACVLYSFLRFLFIYVRLRENRQLRVKGIQELSKRTRLRWLAAAKSAEARRQIEMYLQTYPIETEKDRRQLTGLGLTDEAIARLKVVRAELLDHDKFASTDQWFHRFRDGFQSVIDEAADRRTKYWASRIWVVTAVAPNAVIDSGATLFYTFSMLSDLCQLYNLRAGRAGTAVLMGRTFFNAYLAGQGTEWEKLAEDQYDQLFHEAMNAVGVGVSANMVGKVVGKVGAKVTTGYLNRVLLIRLGRYAARLLRPVTKD
jgi:putative membrane protein